MQTTDKAGDGPRSSEGLGVGAEARQPTAYFSEAILRDAVMSAADEALVKARECPKCRDSVLRTFDGDGIQFSQCIGCGCMFVVSA